MDYKQMTDSELARVMVNYINRVSHLMEMISRQLDGSDGGAIPADKIRQEYKVLKDEIRRDADYLDLTRNREGSDLYMYAFSKSIREASAFGFTVASNSKVNHAMFSAVEEAHYKLRKYNSLETWGNLM